MAKLAAHTLEAAVASSAVLAKPELRGTISSGQIACLLTYAGFFALWVYAELVDFSRRGRRSSLQDEENGSNKESPPVMQPLGANQIDLQLPDSNKDASAEAGVAKSGLIRCLALDHQALVECKGALKAVVECCTILLWFYVADRTSVFEYGAKSYSRDVLGFIFLGLTLVALFTSLKQCRVAVLLNRQQTEEWKGWMQVLFLLYHYFEAKEVYNAIRVFIAGYVWMTGFGNFSYYYKTGDFAFPRFCQMMWRLNFLVVLVCIALQNNYMLYYICPMHTLFTIMVYVALGLGHRYNKSSAGITCKLLISVAVVFLCWDVKPVFYAIWSPFQWLMGYSDPRNPTSDLLHEWYFRSSLDRYVWIHGMLFAYLHPSFEAALQRIDKMSTKARVFIRTVITAVTLALFAVWYHYIYLLPKREYNRVHPYTSWIPITLWVVLRNVTPAMRHFSLSLYGWLGCITLETYISQFHTWLATGVPNGQPKMLLTFFPAKYPLLNFAASTAVYVFVSHRLFIVTNDLKSVVIPSAKVSKLLWRNFGMMAVAVIFLYVAAYLILRVLGINNRILAGI